MTEDLRLCFIGAGNMAGALIRGLVSQGTVSASNLVASDPDAKRLDLLAKDLGIRVTSDNASAVSDADIVVLATKPQVLGDVLPGLADALDPKACIVSIAAGISTAYIERHLAEGVRVVRTMPNTPALVGAGATAIAPGAHATDEDLAVAQRLFESVGTVVRVPESQLDAVTALSGSGPAYVFSMVEALRDAGIREGLDSEQALRLAAQTLFGAAKLLLEGDESPEGLRKKVTSPGGTTEAGIEALSKGRFHEAVFGAVRAAARRSAELGSLIDG